jgi:NAD(P)-dependent dehydrogenase (short-subunit alcohol dehydrogenase family)
MVNLARNVAARGVIVGLVNPGVVDTDMMAGAPIPKQSPEESVTAVRKIIDGLTPEMSGTFRHYTGEELPW